MTAQTVSRPALRAGLFGCAAAAIRSATAAFLRKRRMRRTRMTLHGLSDHILRDIGVHRIDIDSRWHSGNQE